MAKKLPYSAKPILLLAGLLIVWWLVPAVVKSLVRLSFYEFQAPVWTVASGLRDLQDYWAKRSHSKHDLIEAGRDLARLNSAWLLRVQENENLRAEVARLEKMLELPSHPEYRYEEARVIRREMSSWWQQLVIRKGARDGVRARMAVVYSGGVVGRIKQAHLYTSTVELVSSSTFRVAAHLENDERPVTYQGGINLPFHPPRGEIFNVQPDVVVSALAPRRLVSSRLGGVFPDGLTLGWVERITPSPDGLFQRGRVRLKSNLLKVKEVAVLIPLDGELPQPTGEEP